MSPVLGSNRAPSSQPLTCDLPDAVVSVTLPPPCTPAFQCQLLHLQEFPRVASPCFSPSLLTAAVTLYPLNEVTALLASAFKLHATASTPPVLYYLKFPQPLSMADPFFKTSSPDVILPTHTHRHTHTHTSLHLGCVSTCTQTYAHAYNTPHTSLHTHTPP